MSTKFKFVSRAEGVEAVTTNATISSNFRLFYYAKRMCDIAVKLAHPNKKRFLVLGHGMGCMTMSLYGAILHSYPYYCNNITIDAVESNPFMLKRAVDMSAYKGITVFKTDANDFIRAALKSPKYDAILYDLFKTEFNIVWVDIASLLKLTDVLVFNIIEEQDLAKLISIACKLKVHAIKIDAEIFGPYYNEIIPNISLGSSNKIVTFASNIDFTHIGTGCVILDMEKRLIHTRDRISLFNHFGMLGRIPLASIGR